MTKYVVIRTDGRTEFDTMIAAQEYFDTIPNGLSIMAIDENIPASYPDKEVACWRMRAVMELAGLKPQIDMLILGLPQPDKTVAFAAWEYGNSVASSSPFVKGIQAALNLTDAQVYDFFVQAENLQA